MATTPEFVALREDDNCGASSHLVLQTLLAPHHPVTLEETLEDFEVSHDQTGRGLILCCHLGLGGTSLNAPSTSP